MNLTQQAMRDDVEFLKTVSQEDLLNTRDSNDLSALHHAVLKDQQDCVEVICERCPELVYHQAKLFSDMTALMLAAERGHPSMVKSIFEASIKVERDSNGGKKLLRMKDKDERSALWWAVCSNQLEVTKFLLEKDPDFEHGPDVNSNTLLMAAEQYAKSNYLNAGEILELVIEHQKRNEGDGTKQTIGSSPDVEFLKTVSQEDLLNTRDSNNLSALHHAVLKDQQDCVEVICERCPELVYHQAKLVFNMTPLMLAATRGHLSMIPILLDASIKAERDSNGGKKLLTMEDTDKRSALWWAVCSHHVEVTKFLLEADPEFELGTDVNGDTLVMVAERYSQLNYHDAGRILGLVVEQQKRNEQRSTFLHREQTSTPTTPLPKGDGGDAEKVNRPSETMNVPAPANKQHDTVLLHDQTLTPTTPAKEDGGDAVIIHGLPNEAAEKEHKGTELLGAASGGDTVVMVDEKYAKSNYTDAGKILKLVTAAPKEPMTSSSSDGDGVKVNLPRETIRKEPIDKIVEEKIISDEPRSQPTTESERAVMNSTPVSVPAPPEPAPASDLQGDLIIVLLVLLIAIAVKVLIKI